MLNSRGILQKGIKKDESRKIRSPEKGKEKKMTLLRKCVRRVVYLDSIGSLESRHPLLAFLCYLSEFAR